MNARLVGFGLVAAAIGYGHYAGAQKREDVIAKYELNDAQVAMMDQCKDSLSRYNKEFKQSINTVEGCGCIAQQIAMNSGPDEYTSASAALHILIGSTAKSSTTADDISAVRKKFSVDEEGLNAQLPVSLDAMAYCGKAENYMTEEQRATVRKYQKG